MSHLVNPAGFRPGKTFLWSSNLVGSVNNKQTSLDNGINLARGLEKTANSLLRRSNYWTVRSAAKFDAGTGVARLNLLYYPLVVPLLRKKIFPTYCAPRSLLSRPSRYTTAFKGVVSKIWLAKNLAFSNRFIKKKRRPKFNLVVRKAMFRGTKLFRGLKRKLRRSLRSKRVLGSKIYLRTRLTHYRAKKNRWVRWRQSKRRLSSRLLSKLLSKRTGTRVQVRATNVFTYLLKKGDSMTFSRAQKHIWNKRYHYNKRRFSAYYDMVNALWLLCHIPSSEALVMRMIRYGLAKMHRRKIRPKSFFYFINSIVQNMPEVRQNFNAFRVTITGKLRGGTSRTKSFSTGFGMVPRQTLDKNIRYEFGNVRSKYGSFGVSLLTWRKSHHELLTDRRVRWSTYHEKRSLRQGVRTELRTKKKRMSISGRKRAGRELMTKRRSLLRFPIAKRIGVERARKVRNSLDRLTRLEDGLLFMRSRLNRIRRRGHLSAHSMARLHEATTKATNLSSTARKGVTDRQAALDSLKGLVYSSGKVTRRSRLDLRYKRLLLVIKRKGLFLKHSKKYRPVTPSLPKGQRYAGASVKSPARTQLTSVGVVPPKPQVQLTPEPSRPVTGEAGIVRKPLPKIIDGRTMAALIRGHLGTRSRAAKSQITAKRRFIGFAKTPVPTKADLVSISKATPRPAPTKK